MTSEQIIAVGKALLPYLRADITNVELGTAAHDAVVALNRTESYESVDTPQPLNTAALRGFGSQGPEPDDPTARGDLIAEKVRTWYEANRESWWDRHKFWPFAMSGPDRTGEHADEFILRLITAVGEAYRK